MKAKRLKIIMDYEGKIRPDRKNNYVVSEWDDSLEDAVETAMLTGRTELIIRPEGLDLKASEL